MKELLRDRAGRTIGYTITDSRGVKQAFSPSGKRLGQYNPSLNITQTPEGATVAFGDASSSLITEEDQKES